MVITSKDNELVKEIKKSDSNYYFIVDIYHLNISILKKEYRL